MQATAYQAGPWHSGNNQAIFRGRPAIVHSLTARVAGGDRRRSKQR